MITRHEPFSSKFFTKNRTELCELFSEDSLILLQASEKMVRNQDQHYFWRQNSSFFYFTGIEQPDCSLLMFPQQGDLKTILFIPPVDPLKERWEGEMLTLEKAKAITGVNRVLYQKDLSSVLFREQKWRETLFCEFNEVFADQPFTQQHWFLKDLQERLPFLQIKNAAPKIAKLRVRKKPEEISYLKKSIEIIKISLEAVQKKLKPGMWEYQIEAEIMFHYLHHGCTRVGYDPIVAGGKNAAVLHYTANAAQLQKGDLLLIDAGGKYGMYSGDITRVFSVNGKFSPRQRKCYDAVLEVQEAVINAIKPGQTYQSQHEEADSIQGEIMAKHGFVKNPKEHNSVTFHRIGHYLGLDIHDVGSLDWKLEPGSVFTIEPGLYLPEENIGIRIEDNILITDSGIENLSQAIPK